MAAQTCRNKGRQCAYITTDAQCRGVSEVLLGALCHSAPSKTSDTTLAVVYWLFSV